MMAKILCIGDLHLGRVPGLSQRLCEDAGLTPLQFGPTAAWHRIVDYACEVRPNAVVFVGDIIDKDNRFYEAFGPLETGLNKLKEAGIPAYGVAGNHDSYCLPRMTRSLPNFRLIGQGGRWEVVELPDQCARLTGWSFSKEAETECPLLTFGTVRDEVIHSPIPVIGLLHGDLDVVQSRYAPVSRQDLIATGTQAWLLGHIHKPCPLAGQATPIGYLGSCVGLDPTETGVRGPWMLEISPGGAISMTHIPLAPLRWEVCDLPLDKLANPDDLESLVIARTDALFQELEQTRGAAKAIGCRLRMTGRTTARRVVLAQLATLEGFYRKFDDVTLFVDKADASLLRPALDLEALRTGDDPPSILAGFLWEIEQDTAAGRQLVEEASPGLMTEAQNRAWTVLNAAPVTKAETRRLLLESGLNLLESLLSQKPAFGRDGGTGQKQ